MDEQEVIRRAIEELRTLGEVSRTTAESMRSMSLMGRAGGALGQGLATAYRATRDYTRQMYAGQRGAAAFSGAIDETAGALRNMLRQIPVVGEALAELAGDAADAGKALLEMNDRIFDLYRDVGRFGASAADGMMGLARSAQALGFGLDQADLGRFAQLLENSAQGLSQLGGTVADGRRRFVEINNLVRSSQFLGLANLGLRVEELNEVAADYIIQTARLGMIESRTTEELRQGAAQYAVQLDALTKLTGVQRRDLQQEIVAAQSNQRFRARMQIMEQQGMGEQARAISGLIATLAASGQKDFAEGLSDIISAGGGVVTAAAGRALRATQGEVVSVAQQLLGGGGVIDAFQQLAAAAGRGAESFGPLALFQDITPIIGDYVKLLELSNKRAELQGDLQTRIRQQQDGQMAGADGLVDANNRLQIAQMNQRDSLQNFVTQGLDPATQALNRLAGAAQRATQAVLPGSAQQPIGGAAAPASVPGAPSAAPQGIVPQAQDALTQGPRGNGGLAQVLDRDSRRAAQDQTQRQQRENLDQTLAEVIKFTSGGSGSRAHFDKLQPQVREAFVAMAQDYYRYRGQPLQINSAFRSEQEQQALIDRGSASAAEPGRSLHQQGRAIDLNSADVAWLAQSGFLGRHGFRRVSNSPSHIEMALGGVVPARPGGTQVTLGEAGFAEAVFPLQGGRGIPVDLGGFAPMMRRLDQLPDIVAAAMQTQDAVATTGMSGDRESLGVLREISRHLDMQRPVLESILAMQSRGVTMNQRLLEVAGTQG